MSLWDWITTHVAWVGSVLTACLTLWTALRKLGGPWRVIRSVRSWWAPYKTILDLQDELDDWKVKERQAREAEARATKRAESAEVYADQANKRTEEIAATLQLMVSASTAVREAREKGLIGTLPPSSPPLDPLPATSSISPLKHDSPRDHP